MCNQPVCCISGLYTWKNTPITNTDRAGNQSLFSKRTSTLSHYRWSLASTRSVDFRMATRDFTEVRQSRPWVRLFLTRRCARSNHQRVFPQVSLHIHFCLIWSLQFRAKWTRLVSHSGRHCPNTWRHNSHHRWRHHCILSISRLKAPLSVHFRRLRTQDIRDSIWCHAVRHRISLPEMTYTGHSRTF